MHSLAEEVSIWVARSDALRGLSGEHRSSYGKNQSRPKNDKNHSRGEDRKEARTAETGQGMDVDTGGRSSGGTKREGSAQEDPPARRHEGVPLPKRVREGKAILIGLTPASRADDGATSTTTLSTRSRGRCTRRWGCAKNVTCASQSPVSSRIFTTSWEYYDEITGELLDPELVARGRQDELERSKSMHVYKHEPRDQVTGKLVKVKWVRTNVGTKNKPVV